MINWNSKLIQIQKNTLEVNVIIHLTPAELCDILYKLREDTVQEIIIEVLNNSPKDFWEKIKEAMDENN